MLVLKKDCGACSADPCGSLSAEVVGCVSYSGVSVNLYGITSWLGYTAGDDLNLVKYLADSGSFDCLDCAYYGEGNDCSTGPDQSSFDRRQGSHTGTVNASTGLYSWTKQIYLMSVCEAGPWACSLGDWCVEDNYPDSGTTSAAYTNSVPESECGITSASLTSKVSSGRSCYLNIGNPTWLYNKIIGNGAHNLSSRNSISDLMVAAGATEGTACKTTSPTLTYPGSGTTTQKRIAFATPGRLQGATLSSFTAVRAEIALPGVVEGALYNLTITLERDNGGGPIEEVIVATVEAAVTGTDTVYYDLPVYSDATSEILSVALEAA